MAHPNAQEVPTLRKQNKHQEDIEDWINKEYEKIFRYPY